MTREKLLLKSLKRLAAAKLRHKLFYAGGMSRSRQDGIHGHTRPGAGLCQAARNCQLSGLCHAVMNHLRGRVDGALAADENDPPPLPLRHAGKIGATEAHAAEDAAKLEYPWRPDSGSFALYRVRDDGRKVARVFILFSAMGLILN